jgi:hypothetical protein
LYVIAEMLAAGRKAGDIVISVGEQVQDLLFLDSCRFDPSVTHSGCPVLDRAGELQYGQLDWPLDTEGLPNRDVILPVECQGRPFGCYVLRGPALGVPLAQDRLLAAVALSDLAGAALRFDANGYQFSQHSIPSNN